MHAIATVSMNTVAAIDEPGPGNMHHAFEIQHGASSTKLQFQKGARADAGSTPGVMMDDLLAIVQDCLSRAQEGPFNCTDNAQALLHVKGARMYLARRVAARMAAGVLGKSVPLESAEVAPEFPTRPE